MLYMEATGYGLCSTLVHSCFKGHHAMVFQRVLHDSPMTSKFKFMVALTVVNKPENDAL